MVLKTRGQKPEIQEFTFASLNPKSNADATAQGFEFKSLNNASAFKNNISDTMLANERQAERSSAFRIDDKVRESRGLNRHEAREIEQLVAKEVEKRVVALKEQAYNEGFQAGEAAGEEKAFVQAQQVFQQQVDQFNNWLEQVQQQADQVLIQGQQNAYHMIKNLVKWIVIKEVDNQDYIIRLLERLVLEMNSKSNLVIRVNQSAFAGMEYVLEQVQERVGKLTNVRVEAHLDLQHPGLVLECENGIVNGSLEAQLSSLDRIFESVMKSNEA